jgi:hypothetical protein
MATSEVQLVGVSTKRSRRGEPEFRDAAWADGIAVKAIKVTTKGGIKARARVNPKSYRKTLDALCEHAGLCHFSKKPFIFNSLASKKSS